MSWFFPAADNTGYGFYNGTNINMSNLRLRQIFLAAVIVIGIFIGYGTTRFPRIGREAGILSLLIPVAMLLIYSVIAIWITHQPTQLRSRVLKFGTLFGLLIGTIFILDMSVENFVELDQQAMTVSTLGFMLLIFLVFACAGWNGTMEANQLPFGILTSVWSAMIGVVIALLFGFLINFLFTQRLELNLQFSGEFIRSGSHDLETFTFWNTLDSASSHLLEAPILAIVFGMVGSLASLGLNRFHRSFSDSKRE
jgi:hypothetical protein